MDFLNVKLVFNNWKQSIKSQVAPTGLLRGCIVFSTNRSPLWGLYKFTF